MRAALGFVALALTSAGCSATVVDPASVDSGAEALSVVEVRAHQASSAPSALTRLDASARFLSVGKDTREAALGLLGLGWAPPPAGTCSAAKAPAPSSAAHVDLRDLSPVSVSLVGEAASDLGTFGLEPRAFPDVAGLVSGVVFVPAGVPAAAAPGGAWTGALTELSGSRLDAVTFSVGGRALAALELPELPAKVRLVGATPLALAGAAESWGVDVRGFDVTVDLVGADPVVVEVLRAGVTHARCGFDAGRKLRIDAASLGGAGDVTLLVRAQRRVLRDDVVLGHVDARLERSVEIRVVAR